MRFELTEACTSPPFQDGALNRSANPPEASFIIHKRELIVIKKFLKMREDLMIKKLFTYVIIQIVREVIQGEKI